MTAIKKIKWFMISVEVYVFAYKLVVFDPVGLT